MCYPIGKDLTFPYMPGYSPDRADVEAFGKAREAALVEDVLRSATEEEYRNLSVKESPKTYPQRDFIGKNFSGKLGGHDVEIFSSGGYDRTLRIDGILIHSRHAIDETKTVTKPSADESIVNEFFDHFARTQEKLLRESARGMIMGKTKRQRFPKKMGGTRKLISPKKMG